MKPLDEYINCYPSFQPNQVLTNYHLNRLADFLEQQQRLTRRKLIGTGIACGLVVSLETSAGDGTASIVISHGVGITTEGYLIRLDESDCTPDEACNMEGNGDTPVPPEVPGDRCICTHYRPFTDKNAYAPFRSDPANETTQYTIYEIITDPGEAAGNAEPITETWLNLTEKKWIVLLYLEIFKEEINKCLDESCNEKGKRWKFTVRKLMVESDVMDDILDNLNHRDEASAEATEEPLPEVYIERFAFDEKTGTLHLDAIGNLDTFINGYRPAVEQGGTRLANALHHLYSRYQPIFDPLLDEAGISFEGYEARVPRSNHFTLKLLSIINNNKSKLAVQYVYDFINDLKAAYDELAAELADLTCKNCSNPPPFPRHLMLGELKEYRTDMCRYDPADDYRHPYIPAFLYKDPELMLNIKKFMQRLVLMIKNFNWEGLPEPLSNDIRTQIKITPDNDCSAPLGQRAIPFYYMVGRGKAPLSDYWDFESSKRGRKAYLLGYHFSDYTGGTFDRVTKPLLYGICQYPKLRIEGHVGMKLPKVVKELRKLRECYNLSFDIIILKLDSTKNFDINSIYPPDNNLIADLQAMYLVHRSDIICSFKNIQWENIEKLVNIISQILSDFKKYSPIILELYYNSLRLLPEYLPDKLIKFNPQQFMEAYENVDILSSLIKKYIDEAKKYATKKKMYSELIYHELYQDEIIERCWINQLITLYKIFINRVKKISFFSHFNSNIHGMEHIAGTIRGGTFILVYQDLTEDKEDSEDPEYKWITGTVYYGKDVIPGVLVTVTKENHEKSSTITNVAGNFRVQIPIGEKGHLSCTIEGFPTYKIPLSDINVEEHLVVRLESFKEINKGMSEDPIIRNSLLFDWMSEELKGMKGFKEIVEKKKSKGSASQTRAINFAENPNFQVVGDFYLPGKIPGHFMEIQGKLR